MKPSPSPRTMKLKTPPERRAARFRILPVTLSLLGLMTISKASDVYFGIQAIQSASAEEKAKEEAKDKEADAAKEGEQTEAAGEEGGHGESKSKGGNDDEEPVTEGTGKTTLKKIEEVKERQAQERFTPVELDILQSLKERREKLDAREKEIELKLKVLDVAEERLDSRMNEMRELQQELKLVLNRYEDKQDNEIRGLVKIYESMKPVDAATIFNELDMPILLSVVDKMSERKVAPVLAAMDPKRAKDVTEELAEMRKLQRLKSERANQLLQPAN